MNPPMQSRIRPQPIQYGNPNPNRYQPMAPAPVQQLPYREEIPSRPAYNKEATSSPAASSWESPKPIYSVSTVPVAPTMVHMHRGPPPPSGSFPADYTVRTTTLAPPSPQQTLTPPQKPDREVPKKLRGCANCCSANLPCRARRVHHYLAPSHAYQLATAPGAPGVSTTSGKAVLRHRDYVRREEVYDPADGSRWPRAVRDRYLHHDDGKLRSLIVACSDPVWDAAVSGSTGATWRRTYARPQAALKVRIAAWVIDYSPKRNCSWYCIELLKTPVAMAGMMMVVSEATPPIFRCANSRGCSLSPKQTDDGGQTRATRRSGTSTTAMPNPGAAPWRTCAAEPCGQKREHTAL
jgi:hypothetical protein